MHPRKPISLQEIIQRYQRNPFVGRENQEITFRRILVPHPGDERRCFLFNVNGQPGVGKSTLLRRFRHIADEQGMHYHASMSGIRFTTSVARSLRPIPKHPKECRS